MKKKITLQAFDYTANANGSEIPRVKEATPESAADLTSARMLLKMCRCESQTSNQNGALIDSAK